MHTGSEKWFTDFGNVMMNRILQARDNFILNLLENTSPCYVCMI